MRLKNGNNLSGIREMDNRDIDHAWMYFHSQAVKRFNELSITGFEVVMVSKHSNEVKAYIKKEKKSPRIQGLNEQFNN